MRSSSLASSTAASPKCHVFSLKVAENDIEKIVSTFNFFCVTCLLVRQAVFYRRSTEHTRVSTAVPREMDPFLLPMYASVLGVAGAVLLIRSLMFELNVFSPSTVDSTPSVLATLSQITINLIEGGFRFTVAAYLVQASSGVRAMRRAAWLGFLAVLVHAVMLYWATHRSTHNSPRAFFMSWLGGVNAKYWLAINLVDWAQFSALLVFQAVRAFQHGTAALRPSSTGFLVFLWLVFGSFVGVELLSVSMESQSQGVYRAQSEAATCWTICTSGCYYLLWPPILYWALRRDSLQWRQLAVKYNGANHSWSRSQPSGQTSADSSSTRAGRFGTDTSAEGPRALQGTV